MTGVGDMYALESVNIVPWGDEYVCQVGVSCWEYRCANLRTPHSVDALTSALDVGEG